MADTKAQVEAEKWIRENKLPRLYGQTFRRRSLLLKSKGEFKFDAVSDDGNIVALISTSSGINAKGELATGSIMKIRSDIYWFMMLEQQPNRKLLVFTEQSMIDIINEEKKKGRFPSEFEIVKIKLPQELADRVIESKEVASREVSPNNT